MNLFQNITPVLMADPEFSITSLLKGSIGFLQDIGGYVIILAGIILMIVGVIQIAKGLAGGGKGQTNWVMSIACLGVGGALAFGGWTLISSIAKSGKGTVVQMEQAGQAAGESDPAFKGQDGLAEF